MLRSFDYAQDDVFVNGGQWTVNKNLERQKMSEEAVVKPGGAETKRTIVITLITVLLAILGLLVYYYFNLVAPKKSLATKKEAPKDLTFIRSIYGPSANDTFNRPHDVSLDNNNNMYIADSKNNRIVVFDRDGDFLRIIKRARGANKGQTLNPVGVGVDVNGDIYIADTGRHAVIVLDRNGNFLREWRVMTPLTPRVRDDRLYLSTYGPFYLYSKDGNLLRKLGKRSRTEGNFDFSNGVGFDKDTVYVADSMNNRIVALGKNMEIKWTSGKPSKGPIDPSVKYDVPSGIAVDEYGLIYSAEVLGNSITVTSNKGKKIENIGDIGRDDGFFNQPTSIAYQGNRRFVIVDEGNSRVQIIQIPITQKMAKAIEKEAGKRIAVTAGKKSLLERIRELLGI